MNAAKYTTIDGSQGEGGGQIVRTSLSLSAVLRLPMRLVNIRAGRPKPGLAAQHVTCCRAVAAVCGGELTGAQIGSSEVALLPGASPGGEAVFDVSDVRPSAGSVLLVLQSILPPLLFANAPSRIVLRGGTDVPWSPVYDYVATVFLPMMQRMGVQAQIERTRAGWYPRGGGEVILEVKPLKAPLQPFQWHERGEVRELFCCSSVAQSLPAHIAPRQVQGVKQSLGTMRQKWHETLQRPDSLSPGTTCMAGVRFEHGAGGFTALGERGKPAERVGTEAGSELRDFIASGAAVDTHLADQLLLYAALADGPCTYSTPVVSSHLKTNALVIEQLSGISTSFSSHGAITLLKITGSGQTHKGGT